MWRNTNVHASQVLCRATEPWTVKMSGPINNNAASSLPDCNVCTCIFRWSAWKVYLCLTVGKFCWLGFSFSFFFLSRLGPESGASAMGLITALSLCIRFKATKPQGSGAAAACSAQQQLQIWWHRTSQCEGVSLPEKRRGKKPHLLDLKSRRAFVVTIWSNIRYRRTFLDCNRVFMLLQRFCFWVAEKWQIFASSAF